MTKEEQVNGVLDEAYELICNRLEELGIKYDSLADDAIFYDDDGQRKTFCINLYQHKCDVYEGEEE